MAKDIKDLLADGIHSSGFPFEHKVYEALRKRGWSVLSNRYYIDSEEHRPREIDIVAYKSHSHPDYDVRTVLIISCKKVESKKWMFLTREDGVNHPNINWDAMHWSSNYAPFLHRLQQQSWKERFKRAVASPLFDRPPEMVFAYQEMEIIKEERAKCIGDSAIRGSILSAMKAQFHEAQIQSVRRKGRKPRLYFFNLLTVTNADMFRIKMDLQPNQVREIQHISYLSDYILDKKNAVCRIEIVNFSHLNHVLEQYEAIHKASVQFYSDEHDQFYRTVLWNQDTRSLFAKEFSTALWIALMRKAFRDVKDLRDALEGVELFWSKAGEPSLELLVDLDMNRIESLNQNENVRIATADALRQVYRYEGPFCYEEAIPF